MKNNNIHKSEIYTIKKALARLKGEKAKYEIKFIDPDYEDLELQKTLQANRKKCKQEIAKSKIKLFKLEANEDTYEHLPAIRKIIKNPLTIWQNENTDTKQLLLKVMFN